MSKTTLFVHASAAALIWSGAAWAQDARPARSGANAGTASPASSSDSQDAGIRAGTQTATPPPLAAQDGVAPAAEQAAAARADVSDIVVTGSRVITNGNSSPTPVTMVAPQAVQKVQPGNLAETLQILPVFSGSRGSGSNPSATGSVGAGNGSANQLNLRNLGAQETLVLMDGKRVPPTLISGIVDVDSIPEMMVSRVDVVTGGASAVYGSDAVAGVVNYILDKKLKGFKIVAESGISERGDAGKYRAGVAWGTDLFDGRGHFEASYQYQKEDGVLRRSDRSWLQQAGVTGAGTAANPYVNQKNLRQSGFSSGGVISSAATAAALGFPASTRLLFNPDGTVRPFVAGTATGTSAIQIGGDGAFYDSSLLAPLEFNQFFGRFDYDFSDSIHGYVEAGGNIKSNTSYADNLLLQNVTISAQDPYLLPAYRNALAAAGQQTFTLSEIMTSGPRLGTEASTRQINVAAGLSGGLGAFQWATDYVHGQAILKSKQFNNVNSQHLAEALDAVTDSTGKTVCRIALTNASTGCSPLNPFGAGAPSSTALGYVQQDTHYRGKTVLDDVTASVSGPLVDAWAGPLTVALSGEWRKVSFVSQSDATPNDFANCAGLRFNCSTTTPPLLWLNTFPATPKISNTVKEGAIEANLPLIRDVSFIQSLDINGAARYTSYQTSGDYWTWKIGIDWHLSDTLRVRGTRSRDIRAPTLNDLFAPTFISIVNPSDLLTNTAPRVPAINRSNPNLKAEIGNTFTAGIVWRPSRKFNIAVDYYHIKVNNAITQLQGQTAQIQQLCYASNGTSPYCALQVRPNGFTDRSAANAPTAWISQSINLSSIETTGVDVEANYQGSLIGRPLVMRFLGAYQPHIYYRQPGVPTSDQGGAAFGPLGAAAAPTVRLTGILHYEATDSFAIDLLERWRNPMKLSGVPGEVWVNNHLSAFATTNVTVTFKPHGMPGAEFYANVQNLFDSHPPTGGYTGNGTRAGLRDGFPVSDSPLGRFFTAGVRFKF